MKYDDIEAKKVNGWVQFDNVCKVKYKDGKQHNEEGPAAVWSDDLFFYLLNGVKLSKSDWEAEVAKPATLEGKTATIDGKEYTLTIK